MTQEIEDSFGRPRGSSPDIRRLARLAEAFSLWHCPAGPPADIARRATGPAVAVEDSVHPDFLICLETGERVTLLRRHLQRLGLTIEEYRRRWRLPPDYPTTAPNYAAARSAVRAARQKE